MSIFPPSDRRLISHAGKHLRDMPRFNSRSLAFQLAGHVHQAAEIAGKQGSCARRVDIARFLLDDGVGDVRIFHAKCAAEAAADVGVLHFDELQSLDGSKQCARLGLDAELPQTRNMNRDR